MKKQSVFQRFLLVLNIIYLVKMNSGLPREHLKKEFENNTERPDALDSHHSWNQPKQRRRETSVTWIRSRLEELKSGLKETLDHYESELMDILLELPSKSFETEENSQLLSSIRKLTTRKDHLLRKINNNIEKLNKFKGQRDMSSLTSGQVKKLYNVQKDINKLRRFYSEISVKINKLCKDFEKL